MNAFLISVQKNFKLVIYKLATKGNKFGNIVTLSADYFNISLLRKKTFIPLKTTYYWKQLPDYLITLPHSWGIRSLPNTE